MENERVIICEFKKGSGEIVKVTVGEFRGQYYLDFRVWYYPEGSEEIRPTKKGISLHVEMIPELLKGIQDAAAYIRRMYSSKVADSGESVDSPEETPGREGIG